MFDADRQPPTLSPKYLRALVEAIVLDSPPKRDDDLPRLTLSQIAGLNFYIAEMKLIEERMSPITNHLMRDDLDETGLGFIFCGSITFQVTLKSPGGVYLLHTGVLNASDMTGLAYAEANGIGWYSDEELEWTDLRGAVFVDDEEGEVLAINDLEIQDALGEIVSEMLDWSVVERMLAPLTASTYLQRYLRNDLVAAKPL